MPNNNVEQSNTGELPKEDVVGIAGAIAQRLIEPSGDHGELIAATGETSVPLLKDMSPEQLTEWYGLENIHNGTHFMSSADNQEFQGLCATDLKEAVRFLRDKWGEYADREFIDSFTLVHWVPSSENGIAGLERLVGDSNHEVEISTQAYGDQESLINNPRWQRAKFGILIDGQVNLASNQDIQTNQWHGLQEDDDVKRRKYTEWANRLMTNSDNSISPYEFVVGDWHATGIIVDPDTVDIDKVTAVANRYNLPIISTLENDLQSTGSNSQEN